MAKLDPDRGWQIVEERLQRTTDPRHRRLLETLRDHLQAEATANFDLLLQTLAPDPEYHFWVDGSGFGGGPKGLSAVASHYKKLYEENRHVVQYDIERIVVDDDAIVTEGWFEQIFPGRVLVDRGAEVDDPDAAYQLTMRLVLIWPFDKDGKLVGEDSYSDGSMFRSERIRKLAPAELPESYFLKPG